MRNDNEKGITLILLVITIIVILILSGSAINMIFSNGGILKTGESIQDRNKKYANQQSEFTNDLMNEVDKNIQTELIDNSGANPPKLSNDMIPVKWVENKKTGGGSWVITDKQDKQWYNYEKGMWANVMLKDGIELEDKTINVNTTDISVLKDKKISKEGSMFVWIPRYAYSITSKYNEEGNQAGNIEVKFLQGLLNTSADGQKTWDNISGANKWNIHPAFTYGEDVSGIWVAKFEASKEGNMLKIKPGVSSLRDVSVNESYITCLEYRAELNSHLMKNVEWGAVAYLSQSRYGNVNKATGKNEEIYANTNSSYITGAEYKSEQGKKTSTTGNVYGIYDMSGGSYEYVASYLNNSNQSLNNGSSLVSASSKMKEVYEVGNIDNIQENYDKTSKKYGDAVWETKRMVCRWYAISKFKLSIHNSWRK